MTFFVSKLTELRTTVTGPPPRPPRSPRTWLVRLDIIGFSPAILWYDDMFPIARNAICHEILFKKNLAPGSIKISFTMARHWEVLPVGEVVSTTA